MSLSAEQREEFFTDEAAQACHDFLDPLEREFNPRRYKWVGAYGLKHSIERARLSPDQDIAVCYICADQLLEVAFNMGFKVEVAFNLGFKVEPRRIALPRAALRRRLKSWGPERLARQTNAETK